MQMLRGFPTCNKSLIFHFSLTINVPMCQADSSVLIERELLLISCTTLPSKASVELLSLRETQRLSTDMVECICVTRYHCHSCCGLYSNTADSDWLITLHFFSLQILSPLMFIHLSYIYTIFICLTFTSNMNISKFTDTPAQW